MLSLDRPVPQPDAITQPYWDAAREHRLVAQHCQHCNQFIFYPRAVCPHDLRSDGLQWKELSGQGSLYSFTVIRQAMHPAFSHDVPYIYALIDLDEGIRMASTLVQCALEKAEIGMKVAVTFDDLNDKISLPKFYPADP